MANFFDQFDVPTPPTPPAPPSPPAAQGNFFDQFDAAPAQGLSPTMAAGVERLGAMTDPAPAPAYDPENSWSDWAFDVAASAPDGLRKGFANMAGLPVEAINAAPKLLNLLPYVDGFESLSERPIGGAQDIDEFLRLGIPRVGALVEDYEPQSTTGRFVNRIGEEIGATALPVAGAAHLAGRLGTQGVRELGPVARSFIEPMAVNPGGVAAREAVYSAAAGTGAQAANELIDPENGEGTWWTDLLGSIGGAGAAGVLGAGSDLFRTAVGAYKGDPKMFEDIAGQAVAARILDNSSVAQQQYARGGRGAVDADVLASQLATPSAAEQAFPGFRANVADRAQDPGLSRLAYDVDATQGGSAALRRNNNARIVDDRMVDLAPEGNATALRPAVQAGADARIAQAVDAETAARGAFDADAAAVSPTMSPPERGAVLRDAIEARRMQEMDNISGMYGQLDPSVPVDATAFRDRFNAVTDSLPLNDQARFLPSEVNTARALAPDAGPVNTGVLDASGNPIMRAPDTAPATLAEILSVRSGLSSDVRAPGATDQQRRVTGKYLDETEQFLMDAVPEQAEMMRGAREARLDTAKRFEDTGAIPDILRSSGRDQYTMPPEAVPNRAMRNETDYTAVMREVGANPTARASIADQLRSEAQTADVMANPARLGKFLQDRNVVLADHPEIRTALEKAGASKATLDEASKVAKQTSKDFSPGGNSAAGQYLRYDDTRTRDAMKTAWNADQPERAMRDLLSTAGDTPETRKALKAALWEEVKGSGQLAATTSTPADGVQRWSGSNLAKRIEDPKFAKAMDIAWADNPEHLTNIRGAADALRRSEGSINAKTPGTSGTAQGLAGKQDRSISTTGIASRVRSVHRGQLSPTIAVVDVLSTMLRNKSMKTQNRAIEEMLAEAINNPDFAAELLRKHNPADAAGNRLFLSRFGVRVPTLANILAEDGDEDAEFNSAIMGETE